MSEVYVSIGNDLYEKWVVQADGTWMKVNQPPVEKSKMTSSNLIVDTAPPQGQAAKGDYAIEALNTTSFGDIERGFTPTDIANINLAGLTEEDAINKIAKEKYGWIGPGGTVAEQEATGRTIPWDKIAQELYTSGWTAPVPATTGLPPMTEEQWSGWDEKQKAEYIFKTKYNATPEEIAQGWVDLNDDGSLGSEDVSLGGGAGSEDLYKLLEIQPLKGDIDTTKAGFLSEEYGGGGTSFADSLAGRTAGQSLATDTYGLQGAASNITAAMQGVYGGTGTGMRAGIAGQKALKTGFETAYEGYDIKKDTSDLNYRKGMYGLEEDVTGTWESDWATFFSRLPSATVS